MLIIRISDEYAVTGQIHPDDVPAIKLAGYRVIMCNRPDGETTDQPPAKVIEKAAKTHGIRFYHIPIGNAGIGIETLSGFSRIVKKGEFPVLAYCQTGGRCKRLLEAFHA